MQNILPTGKISEISRYWLVLAIASLSVAGLFSLPPVILRGPFFADKFNVELVFATALVIHVDLSVVVWFLSIGGFFWSLLAKEEHYSLYKTSFWVAACGMVAIAISPFIGATNPLKNNYIPMLQNFMFVLGLSLFACGIFFQALLTLPAYKKAAENPINFGIYISAIITLIAAICFAVSYNLTPLPEDSTDSNVQAYYESLFWAVGTCCNSRLPA